MPPEYDILPVLQELKMVTLIEIDGVYHKCTDSVGPTHGSEGDYTSEIDHDDGGNDRVNADVLKVLNYKYGK